MDHSVTVSLDGQEYEIHRARLGQYLRIQEASAGLLRASSEGDHRSIVDAIFAFFQVSIPDLTMEQFLENDWMQIAIAYAEIQNLNAPAFDLAIFKYSDDGEPSGPEMASLTVHRMSQLIIVNHLINLALNRSEGK